MRYSIETSFGKANHQALDVVKQISEINTDCDVQFDFTNYTENNPFSNLIIANTLKNFRHKHVGKCTLVPDKGSYLSHLGFYQMFGADYGKEIGEATPTDNYVPITKVKFAGDFYSTIDNTSKQLAALLKFDKKLSQFIEYLFTETIRNVYEHADIDEVYLTAQKWPSKNMLEVAISDTGCGVYTSLRKYVPYAEKSEEELIKMACEPGITARSNYSYLGRDDAWRNSGYGLYLLRKLSVAYGGSFIICSGNYALREDSHGTQLYDTHYDGTTVAIRIKTDTRCDFETARGMLVNTGERESQHCETAVHSASKSSSGHYF